MKSMIEFFSSNLPRLLHNPMSQVSEPVPEPVLSLDLNFYDCPEVIQSIIISYIPTEDIRHLKAAEGVAIERHYNLFELIPAVRLLFNAILECRPAIVRKLIKQNGIEIILKKIVFEDSQHQCFNSISAFQFVLWYLQSSMWRTMLECIPNDETGIEIKRRLLVQYNQVSTAGISFSVDGATLATSHFNYQGTIKRELAIAISLMKTAQKKGLFMKLLLKY